MLLERINLAKALDRIKKKEEDTIKMHEEINRIFFRLKKSKYFNA